MLIRRLRRLNWKLSHWLSVEARFWDYAKLLSFFWNASHFGSLHFKCQEGKREYGKALRFVLVASIRLSKVWIRSLDSLDSFTVLLKSGCWFNNRLALQKTLLVWFFNARTRISAEYFLIGSLLRSGLALWRGCWWETDLWVSSQWIGDVALETEAHTLGEIAIFLNEEFFFCLC